MHTITFLASTSGGHTPRCTLWKNTAEVQTHTMRVILHSSERLSHPQSTRLHASATEPEKSCTYLVSSLEPLRECAGCALQRRADWWVERVFTVHTAHHPECTQAVPRRPSWLVALSHYRREPTSSQRAAYTCLPTETNLTSSNFL